MTDIREGEGGTIRVATEVEGRAAVRHARAVVLATGFEGVGGWRVPDFVSDVLPPERYDHSNGPIDFPALAGRGSACWVTGPPPSTMRSQPPMPAPRRSMSASAAPGCRASTRTVSWRRPG
ncbi:hypothetical protein [Methylobrevis pamukkalensis]|uniref:hypothetical protein n=1 Tax=Methylobrevis pamukkalensis TaxID=1439726 RepID=UPI0014726ABA|nr:hypothetical protein [Methylobrevis pamukkalensis]